LKTLDGIGEGLKIFSCLGVGSSRVEAAIDTDGLGTEASLSECLGQRLLVTGLGSDGGAGGVRDACNIGLYRSK
jgi:hypothetical protein